MIIENNRIRVTLTQSAYEAVLERAADSAYARDHSIEVTAKMLVLSQAMRCIAHQSEQRQILLRTNANHVHAQTRAYAREMLIDWHINAAWRDTPEDMNEFYTRRINNRYIPNCWKNVLGNAQRYADTALGEISEDAILKTITHRFIETFGDEEYINERKLYELSQEHEAMLEGMVLRDTDEVMDIISRAEAQVYKDIFARMAYSALLAKSPEGWTIEIIGDEMPKQIGMVMYQQ